MTDDKFAAWITYQIIVWGVALCGIWMVHGVLKALLGHNRDLTEHERAYFEHKERHGAGVRAPVETKAETKPLPAAPVDPQVELAVAALVTFGYTKQAARDALVGIPVTEAGEMVTKVLRQGG